jgi:hypothetical protein
MTDKHNIIVNCKMNATKAGNQQLHAQTQRGMEMQPSFKGRLS